MRIWHILGRNLKWCRSIEKCLCSRCRFSLLSEMIQFKKANTIYADFFKKAIHHFASDAVEPPLNQQLNQMLTWHSNRKWTVNLRFGFTSIHWRAPYSNIAYAEPNRSASIAPHTACRRRNEKWKRKTKKTDWIVLGCAKRNNRRNCGNYYINASATEIKAQLRRNTIRITVTEFFRIFCLSCI